MHPTLSTILDLLDEGLRIYRRGFVGFVLIAALGMAPLALVIGLLFVTAAWGQQALSGLLGVGVLVLLLPLSFYVVGGLSRAALAVQAGQAVDVRAALAIPPLRLLGMGCFGTVFGMVANAVIGAATCGVYCVMYIVFSGVLLGIGALLEPSGNAGGAVFGLVAVVIALAFLLIYGLSLVVSGATYSSIVYSVLPFALEEQPFGATVQRSLDLLGYRFGRNLLAFVLASAVFSATAVAVTLAMGLLVPLPALWLFGAQSPISQGLSASAWLMGLVVALPPMPIWMTLLYQRNRAAREGRDLAERIAGLTREVRDAP